MPAAKQDWLQGCPRAHPQGTYTLRATDFMSRKRQVIDTEQIDIDQHFAEPLDSIAMGQTTRLAHQCGGFGNGLNDACFIIGQHQREDRRTISRHIPFRQAIAQRVEVNDAVGCDIDGFNRNARIACILRHRLMLNRRD